MRKLGAAKFVDLSIANVQTLTHVSIQLYRNDPINSTMLTTYIRHKLEEGRQNCPGGPAAFDAHMQKADQLVVKQLLEAIVPTSQ